MRTRWSVVLLTASLALNALLAAAWLAALRPKPAPERPYVRRSVVTNILRPLRTNLVLQTRLLTWRDLESQDYTAYVANLRFIGCPEPTVRDILVADVSELFEQRRVAEVPDPAQQWWRAEPEPELLALAAARQASLEAERAALLTSLLGSDWRDAWGAAFGAEPHPLGGPVLGDLTPETRRRVQRLERDRNERLAALMGEAEAKGQKPDATAQDTSERAFLDGLGALLTAEQLEEYQLRYSATASRLRQQLRGFEAAPEEFRRLFRALGPIDRQIEALSPGSAAETATRRAELERQREQLLEETLGAARYAHYRLNQDPVFQQTRDAAERAGVGPEKLLTVYRLNQLALEERGRVLADASLSPEERTRELADLYQQRLESLRALVGDAAFNLIETSGSP